MAIKKPVFILINNFSGIKSANNRDICKRFIVLIPDLTAVNWGREI
jgi:hypothetical protein